MDHVALPHAPPLDARWVNVAHYPDRPTLVEFTVRPPDVIETSAGPIWLPLRSTLASVGWYPLVWEPDDIDPRVLASPHVAWTLEVLPDEARVSHRQRTR